MKNLKTVKFDEKDIELIKSINVAFKFKFLSVF